jgi:hypothetical protein|tara:strand:+ start:2078 stop:2221 length:144 start_codon:yes stop_codon:yes gene_type:complete
MLFILLRLGQLWRTEKINKKNRGSEMGVKEFCGGDISYLGWILGFLS